MQRVANTAKHCVLLLLLAALSLTFGCTPPRSAAPLGGTLDVLGPDQNFIQALSNDDLPDDWVLSGEPEKAALRISTKDQLPSLDVSAGNRSFALVRRIRASMLATPFLSWAWYVHPPRSGVHPVRLIVGLVYHGEEQKRPWWHLGGRDQDAVDRIITIVWNDTALRRGNIIKLKTAKDRPEAAEYIARGGPEQGRRWWVDNVDLSLIHRQIWPHDDPTKIDIRFIGVAAKPGLQPASIGFSSIRLQR